MPTIGDVMDKIHRAEFGIKHFGATDRWKKEFEGYVTVVGKAIVADMSDTNVLLDLTPEIKLGPLGQLAYMNLCTFIQNNSVRRTDSPL